MSTHILFRTNRSYYDFPLRRDGVNTIIFCWNGERGQITCHRVTHRAA